MQDRYWWNKKRIFLIFGIVAFVAVGGLVGYKAWDEYNSITYDYSKALSYAKRFYANGKFEKAIQQLKFFCESPYSTIDDGVLLAQWYAETGREEERNSVLTAVMERYNIAENQLSVRRPTISFKSSMEPIITVEPMVGFTKDVKFVFGGEQIIPSRFEDGGVQQIFKELYDQGEKRSTCWMPIDSNRKSIIMSGSFNCSMWQFMDPDGKITYVTDESSFNDYSSVSLEKQSYSKIDIPEGSIRFRVTFYDKKIGGLPMVDSIVLYYGDFPQGYSDGERVEWILPDLNEGEQIIYSEGRLNLYDKDGRKVQSLEMVIPHFFPGSTLTLEGTVGALVTITYTDEEAERIDNGKKTLQYGIRHYLNSDIPICERIGDSLGMHFNYLVGDAWKGQGEKNDFDNAYPWSDMKLCNVNSNGIVYWNERGFSTDGSNGNVMVEIPKFYVKRICYGDVEEIWISGTKYEGYVIDPVFIVNGVEKDYVYIGTYLGSENEGKLLSVSDAYPTIRIQYDEVLKEVQNNGNGFSEINYFMYSAVQKLYLIETGTLDSTSLFCGETDAYFYSTNSDISRTGIALESRANTNKIVVNDVGPTRKLEPGTSVIIMNKTEEWDSYNRFSTDNLREVVARTISNGVIEIEFDGTPINIDKNDTIIASFPSLTGKTDNISYCTGVYLKNNGRYGFKYRSIENIFGSALVMLDSDSYIEDGMFYFKDQRGETVCLPIKMPIQSTTLDVSEKGYDSGNINCIKKMSYDEKYPTIMIPTEIGASTYSFYCDYYYYSDEGKNEKTYLCMGSADDNRRIGGIFQFRAIITSMDYSSKFMGARIMYR